MQFSDVELNLLTARGFSIEDLALVLKYKEEAIRESQSNRDGDVVPDLTISGIEFPVPQGKSNVALDEIRKALNPRGYQVYFSAMNEQLKQSNVITVLKTSDEYDVLRYHGTNGVNHGVMTDDIIERLKKWKALYGLYVSGANTDWVMFQIASLPEDLNSFVEELVEFCPDYLEQDYYSEHGTDWSKFMIRSTIFYHRIIRLWWD